LLKHNADINSRVYTGATPLSIAIEWHGEGHPFIEYLAGLGAKFMDNDLEPDYDEDEEVDEDEEGDDDEEGEEDEEQEDDDDPEEKDEKEL
jgi:hypothetical protein